MAYEYWTTTSSSLLYNLSYPDTSSLVYPVSTPSISIMPSYTTTVLTSAVTLTSLVTVTSGQYSYSVSTPTPSPSSVRLRPPRPSRDSATALYVSLRSYFHSCANKNHNKASSSPPSQTAHATPPTSSASAPNSSPWALPEKSTLDAPQRTQRTQRSMLLSSRKFARIYGLCIPLALPLPPLLRF
jgi:hypothetical protein